MAPAVETGSRRVDILANPKQFHTDYFEDRPSVYWIDRLPPEPVDGKTEFVTTVRVDQLAVPKKDSSFTFDRSHDELSQVSRGAMSAEASQRVISLANHKSCHTSYQPERSVYTMVPKSAQNAVITPRVEQLANPKGLNLQPVPVLSLGNMYDPILPVPNSARNGTCAPRVEVLAESKQLPPEYKMEKPVQWPILPPVINATATVRLQQLARPKSCKAKDKDKDPYKVPLGALHARPTARVEELSAPIPRKCRQKKV